jgi:hypothetical protein
MLRDLIFCANCDYPLRAEGRDWLGEPVHRCDCCGWRSDEAGEEPARIAVRGPGLFGEVNAA